jgi:hypothetical protein
VLLPHRADGPDRASPWTGRGAAVSDRQSWFNNWNSSPNRLIDAAHMAIAEADAIRDGGGAGGCQRAGSRRPIGA